jgi:hypothetical protein
MRRLNNEKDRVSLSEEQIRFIVRDELRKILDKGLMYSAEVKQPEKKQEQKVDATSLT